MRGVWNIIPISKVRRRLGDIKEVWEAEESIFNIPAGPAIVYLPKNLTDGDVWQGKGGRK